MKPCGGVAREPRERHTAITLPPKGGGFCARALISEHLQDARMLMKALISEHLQDARMLMKEKAGEAKFGAAKNLTGEILLTYR